MTIWYNVSADSFARAGASSLGNGWTDPYGSASIAGSQASFPANAAAWASGTVYRPLAEASVDQRVVMNYPAGQPNATSGIFAALRAINVTGNMPTMFVGGLNAGNNTIRVYSVSAGVLSAPLYSVAMTYNAAHAYTVDFSALGANPTTLTLIVTDTTAGTSATISIGSSLAGIQTAGQAGMFILNGPGIIGGFTEYSDVAPTGVNSGTASVTSYGGGTASVAVTNAWSGNPPFSYQWHRSTGNGFTPSASTKVTGATSTTLNDSGLTNGTTYYYRNVVTDSTSGTPYTANSNQVSATPTSVVTAGAAANTAVASTTATLTVGAPSGGTPPYSYQWYRSTASGFTPSAANKISGATSQTFNDTGLTNNANYYYVNLATDSVGAVGASNQVLVNIQVLAVTSSALAFSPGNWKGDSGRGGSVYRRSWNPGAYFRLRFTAPASNAACTVLMPSSLTAATVAYSVNGKVVGRGIAATGNVPISGLAAGTVNDIVFYLEQSPQATRWADAVNKIEIDGIQLDSYSVPGIAPPCGKWVLIVGDSITEGLHANAGASSNLSDYSYMVGNALLNAGYDYGVSACSASGFIVKGDAPGYDVPAYYSMAGGTYNDSASRWNKIDSGVSLLDSAGRISAYGATGTPPAAIYINYGTNELLNAASLTDLTASITGCVTALRAAAPNARIIIGMPFGIYSLTYNGASYPNGPAYATTIRAAVASVADPKVTLADFGASLSQALASSGYTSDGVHPVLAGHAYIAPLVTQALQAALNPPMAGYGYAG